MPLRLNLLAEAQALEESRRRDPTKRAMLVGVFAILLVLAWSSSLQLRALILRGTLTRVEAQLSSRAAEYARAVDNQKKVTEANRKLSSLHRLAVNRFLQGNLLNALQQPAVDDVELRRLRVDQSYVFTPPGKPTTNDNQVVIPAKPATSTERIVLALDGTDRGTNPGDQVPKFKQAVGGVPYFQTMLGKTNEVRLTNLEPPQSLPNGKPFVLFSVECRFPDKNRL